MPSRSGTAFPLIFYDTGAYLVEGLRARFLVERSPVYSLLLFLTGGAFSLWPVVILQAADDRLADRSEPRAPKCPACRWRGLIAHRRWL